MPSHHNTANSKDMSTVPQSCASKPDEPTTAVAHARMMPATTLPWEQAPDDPGIVVSKPDDFTVVAQSVNDPRGPQDIRYIVHAANAYPGLIAVLQRYLLTADNKAPFDVADVDDECRDLLRELGEIK